MQREAYMNRFRSDEFLWLSIALMPLIGISFLFYIQPQDFWWLMRVGWDTVQHGAVPVTDTISLSQYGKPIIYQPWLAGVILYAAYHFGGITLIYLLRGILIGITYGMIWLVASWKSNPRLATILVFILGMASSNNWSVRSQLFVYPLFVLSILILFRWELGNKRYLWTLPIFTLLWVNLHGSFILPFVLVGSALLFGKGEKRALLIVAAVMFFATLLNPHGFGVWGYFKFMMNSPSDHLFSFEWEPPRNQGWQLNIFFAWILVFAPLNAFTSRKLTILEWFWFVCFGWLALTGLRYVIWFQFILTVFTATLLSIWTERLGQFKRSFPYLNFGFGIFMLILPLMFLPGVREYWMDSTLPVYERKTTPLAATKWMVEHPETCSNLWADYAFGGYLSFAFPSCKPWMDSRFNAFPPEQWTEYLQVSNAERWQEMFDREDINLLLLSTTTQPALIDAVTLSEIWCEKFKDEDAIIFSRCNLLP